MAILDIILQGKLVFSPKTPYSAIPELDTELDRLG